LFGVKHTQGGSGEGRTVRSSRAILLQSCGHYKLGGGRYNKDWLVHKHIGLARICIQAESNSREAVNEARGAGWQEKPETRAERRI